MLKHVWKREFTDDEIMLFGERIWNLGRLLNLREGVEPDTMPRKFYAPSPPSPKGLPPGRASASRRSGRLSQEYYRCGAGSETGVPTEAKLAEIGVDVRL